MSKHTPGPWVFGSVITTEDNVGIAQVIYNPAWPNGEVEANARIIAVAPEMLEFIKQCEVWFARYGDHGHRGRCRELIAKAESRL